MSRQISRRCLLLYFSAILTYGSSRRIPREASCPSCSQDCPEALTVQLPWNSHQESNLRDFSINPLRNSPYSRLIEEGSYQDVVHDDDISLNQNSMLFGNYRFPQQQSASKNFFFKNYLNSPKSLDGQETFSQNKLARRYPLAVPSRQVFDKSENLFLRNPRNKHSESLSEDHKGTKDYKKIEEDPTSKVLIVYRADRDTKPLSKNSKDTSNVIQSEKSSPKENIESIHRLRRQDIFDEGRNTIKKLFNSASQFRYPQVRYNPIGFDPEVKRTPYIKDTDIPKSTKEFFDNWDVKSKDSSQSSNLRNLEQLRNDFFEVHPAKKTEIIAKNDNEQSNYNFYNSKFPQSLNIWESKKDKKPLDSMMRTNIKLFENENTEDVNDYFEDETEHFMNDEDMKDYFEEETEQDITTTKQNNYNPHALPQNWKDIENEELDDLDFVHKNSQKTEQLGLYSEKNNEYFQNSDEQNEDIIFQDKAYTSAGAVRAPVINTYNAYIIPRYLNIINDKNYPAKLEMQGLSETINNIHANPVKEMDQRFFEDEAVIANNTRIQDVSLSYKNNFDIEKYSSPISNKQNNVRNKNEALTELDPDLLDDIEDPPIGTTESTTTPI